MCNPRNNTCIQAMTRIDRPRRSGDPGAKIKELSNILSGHYLFL
ncbi:hypothetical protein C4K18_3392 [Pseudomonas chlororaphis subsp. aurantiaca]|nr:hypothetical protein C4K18_3392 [Pseudomonas chlororaphis subsp. aurantiaca]